MSNDLLCGTGRCDITPIPGTPQGGWGAQLHVRGSVADMPLYATGLAISDGIDRWLIIEADSIGFDHEWTDRILSAVHSVTGVARANIRFSCSHTHSGPNTFRLANIPEGLDLIMNYLEGLPHRIAAAAWQALQNMEPAHVATTVGECYINRNRRVRIAGGEVVVGVNEEGTSDPALAILRFDNHEGRLLATIVHYACHPTTVGWQNDRFTPDYPGPTRSIVEESLGGHCLFLQGAAGDLGPMQGFTGDLAVYHRLGRQLGLTAAGLATGTDPKHHQARFESVMPSGANIAQYTYVAAPNPTPVAMKSIAMHLPIKPLPPHEEIQLELKQLREQVQRARDSGQGDEMLRLQARATQMGWRLENSRLYAGRSTTEWPMQVMRLGSTALVSLAGEPFSSIASRIREHSPAQHTLVSGYSNGGFGYIPDREAYAEGGYEVEATPFSPDAADIVVEQALMALHELFPEKRSH